MSRAGNLSKHHHAAGGGGLGPKKSGIFGADCPAARSADTTYKFTTPPHGLDTPDVKQVINYINNYTANLLLSAEMCHRFEAALNANGWKFIRMTILSVNFAKQIFTNQKCLWTHELLSQRCSCCCSRCDICST